MRRLNLEQDIRPLSEFRANAAAMVQQVRSSGRPLVLTQRGHGAAVVLAIAEYERLIGELELLRDVQLAEQQLEAGQGIDHEEARARVRARLRR